MHIVSFDNKMIVPCMKRVEIVYYFSYYKYMYMYWA